MKHRFFIVQTIFVALIFSLGWTQSMAQESHGKAAQAVTLAVQSQLHAFSEDDAETAYNLATESTKNLAGTPNDFLKVIKQRFTPIYRHRHALFSEPEIIEGHALQVVQLIDHDNLVWIAIYEVEREADGKWKIDGCQLFETNNMSI
jgi:hypothetical protein